jgi:hypothetical protein
VTVKYNKAVKYNQACWRRGEPFPGTKIRADPRIKIFSNQSWDAKH